jgi:hypothetical protein
MIKNIRYLLRIIYFLTGLQCTPSLLSPAKLSHVLQRREEVGYRYWRLMETHQIYHLAFGVWIFLFKTSPPPAVLVEG